MRIVPDLLPLVDPLAIWSRIKDYGAITWLRDDLSILVMLAKWTLGSLFLSFSNCCEKQRF